MAELQPAVGVDSDAWTEVTSGRRAALKTMLDNENYSHSAPQAGVSEASPSPSWSLIGFPHPQLPGGSIDHFLSSVFLFLYCDAACGS